MKNVVRGGKIRLFTVGFPLVSCGNMYYLNACGYILCLTLFFVEFGEHLVCTISVIDGIWSIYWST